MLPTSGTYNFQSIQIELLIREAFERIGIFGEFVEPQKLESAKRSIDFLLLDWMSKSVNLWTLKTAYLPLVNYQGQYILPETVSDIIQVNIRLSSRVLDGTAQSNTGTSYDGAGGGDADNAFDADTTTGCTQNVVDGNISYDYGVDNTNQINFVGIQSNTTTVYNLVVESSQDTATWTNLYTIPTQSFAAGVTAWFDIITPISARAYRIRETGGATLDIREIYFNNNLLDTPIGRVSRYDYETFPNKKLQGRPSCWYLDRQIIPLFNIWPTPIAPYNVIMYSYKEMMQDAGKFYTNTVQIPARFYSALVWGLSWHLALKFNPNLSGVMQGEYERSFAMITGDDKDPIGYKISGDWGNNTGGSWV